MRLPAMWLRHTVTVAPYIGTGPSGAAYGPPTELRGFLEERTRLVRSPTGDQVVSSAQFFTGVEAVCPAKSRVTLPDGRRTTVIAALRGDGGGLPLPSHLEVQLQ